MPEEEKKMVPIDTSGPDAEVDIEEKKSFAKKLAGIEE